MNIIMTGIHFIFDSPVNSAILFMVIFTAIFGYIGLTAKVIKDKPKSHEHK